MVLVFGMSPSRGQTKLVVADELFGALLSRPTPGNFGRHWNLHGRGKAEG